VIEIVDDPGALARAVAREFVEAAVQSVADRGRFTVALAGGSTPRAAYRMLATPAYATEVPWDKVHLFWSDERAVPPSDPDSNYGMAAEALIAHVPIPNAQVHRIEGERPPEAAAIEAERVLRRELGAVPELDLVLLGLGEDGHTASLFPGQPVIRETVRLAAAVIAPKPPPARITFTPVTINAARRIAIVVAGAGKAAILARVLEGPRMPDQLPAQIVDPRHGTLRWLVDRAAAAELRTTANDSI
jgi:6-phosphogluconolactonase